MKYRKLGKTGIEVSEISLGTWQVGGKWGSGFNDALAEQIINEAIDDGVNFIDTYHRTGLYPVNLPVCLGLEAVGIVKGVSFNSMIWQNLFIPSR